MKKRLGIVAAVVLGAVLTVGVVGSVTAEEPPSNEWLQQMWQYCHGANGGAGMMGGGYGMMGGYGTMGAETTNQVAKLLGITPQELLTERNSGKSIFQIAQAKDFSEQQVLDAALAPVKDELALRVKYGFTTEDQVAQLLKLREDRLRTAFGATTTAPATGAGYGQRGMMGGSYGGGGMMGGSYGGGGMMGGGFGGRGTMGGWW